MNAIISCINNATVVRPSGIALCVCMYMWMCEKYLREKSVAIVNDKQIDQHELTTRQTDTNTIRMHTHTVTNCA